MEIEIAKTALKDLQKLEKRYQTVILEKIILLKDFPNAPNIKKLTNHYPPYRFRVAIIEYFLI